MGDIEVKIKSINEKIKKEEQMRQAAVRVKSQTANPLVLAQCEQNIVDAVRHIEYLQKELEKLQIKQRNSLQYPIKSGQQTPQQTSPGESYPPPQYQHSFSYPPLSGSQGDSPTSRAVPVDQSDDPSTQVTRKGATLSNLDLIKSDSPITNQKVSLKLHELEFKLDVERRLKEGSEKMTDAVLLQDPKNKRSIAEVQVKTWESKEKISLLTRSLQKYKQLYIGELDDDEDEAQIASRATRRPVTGNLNIRVNQARFVAHAPGRTRKDPETVVVIKVDGAQKAKTRTSRNDRWNEEFEIYVEKASEVEITIYDKPGENQVPIGLMWIKIYDIAEELRKKRIEAESGGWVTASNAQFDMQSFPPGEPYSVPYSSAQPPQGQGTGTTVLQDGIEAWFEIEPVGQILLKLNFVKESARKRPADAGLGRQGAFRKRKGEVHEQNGHKFVQQIFYQIIKCAYCEELFVNEGFRCEDCKLTCHRRCYTKVVTKCISKSNAEMDSDYKQLNHRIPHRFDAINNLTASWCCHCGYMLSFGKKRCNECNMTCHAKCAHLVPDFCGMTMRRASEMIEQIQQANIVRKVAPDVSVQEKPNVSSVPDQLPKPQTTPPPTDLPNQPYPPPQPYEYPPPSQPTKPMQPTQDNPSDQPAQVPVANPQVPLATQVMPTYAQPAMLVSQTPPRTSSNPSSQPVDASIIKQTRKVGLDDFNFLAVLGKGNFGKVMLAEEKYTKQLYAIKVLKKEFIIENDEVESTRSEKRVFQAANHGRHPFLLGLHSCFQTETRIYFVMEYISGGDLMLHIQRTPFTYRQAQFYAAEVLLALEYLHKQGIIYRDLKLDNILLALDGHIKIADYGLCKEEMWFGNTTNTFCGTPEFMAPEILLEQRYGRAVDWWAFGVLIYEMLLGQSPFRGDDEDEIFDAILEDEILYPINMSRDSVSILQKLLTRDPERRLGSGRADAEDIKRHPFFRGVNWDDMLSKKVPPPYYPSIASATDTSNFDEEFTKEVPVLTPVHSHLTAENQEEFSGFSYVSNWVMNGEK